MRDKRPVHVELSAFQLYLILVPLYGIWFLVMLLAGSK